MSGPGKLREMADYVAGVRAELFPDEVGEDGEQCIYCLRFTYDPHTDTCTECGRHLRDDSDPLIDIGADDWDEPDEARP